MTVLSAIQATAPTATEVLDASARTRPPASAAAVAKAETGFSADLDTVSKPAADADIRPVSAVFRASKSGVLSPVQQFESFVLRSFVETMLPKENASFFGTGTAGQIWKSMLAERIGDEMAKDGGIGIADLLTKRDTAAKAAETAKAASAATDGLLDAATKLQGAERLGSL